MNESMSSSSPSNSESVPEKADKTSGARSLSLLRLVRIGILMAAILVFAYGITWGIIFLRERPLHEAEQYLADEDPASALFVVEEYLEDHPDDVRAHAIQARALVGVERYGDAIKIYDVIREETVEDMRASAAARLHTQQWQSAMPLLIGILVDNPDDPEALHSLIACQHLLGLYGDAQANAERLCTIAGNESQGLFLLGTIHQHLQNYEGTEQAWSQVLEINPSLKDVQLPAYEFYYEFGQVKMELGKPEEALQLFQRSLEQAPSPLGYYRAGRAASALGNTDLARQFWVAALQLDQMHVATREALANEAIREQLPEQAIEVLTPLAGNIELTSTLAYTMQRALTMMNDTENASKWQAEAERLRKREELIATIDAAMRESPQAYWSQVMRAYRFAQDGNRSQAIELAERLVLEHPDEPFLKDLIRAVVAKEELPALEELPIELF